MAVSHAKVAAEDTSERKRISIPKADDSALSWWSTQNDPSLSVRLLIRNEIERSGYTDMAFRPVVQQPRRGRPPGSIGEPAEGDQPAEGTRFEDEPTSTGPAHAAVVHESAAAVREPLHAVETATPREVQPRVAQPRMTQLVPAGGNDLIDNIMNG